jgi:hypothetical protein
MTTSRSATGLPQAIDNKYTPIGPRVGQGKLVNPL